MRNLPVWSLVLALVAVASSPAPGGDAAPAAPAPAAEEAPAAPASPEDLAALAAVDELAREVASMRGLPFRSEFARKVISPAEVRSLMEKKIAEELPPEKLARMSRLYSRMGFFAPSVNLAEAVTSLLEAGAAGMYDPEDKVLYLVRGPSPAGARPVLFHELVHALEDQHYDLAGIQKKYVDHSDLSAAATAVIEGSAQSLMNRYLEAHPDVSQAFMADQMKNAMKQMQALMALPTVIVAGFAIYPYGNGPAFVDAVAKGEREAVGALFARLPESTEQVLHPEKYAEKHDPPTEVTLPDLSAVLPEGYKPDFADTIGEFQLGILLNEMQGGPPAMRLVRIISLMNQSVRFSGPVALAAEGWDGDRVQSVFGPEGQPAFVWITVWDSPLDAAQFAEAWTAGLPYKWKELGLTPAESHVQVRGNKVGIVEGLPEASLAPVLEAAFAGATYRSAPVRPAPGTEAPPTEETK